MRKSERLRLAELQIVRLEMQVEILTGALNSLLESQQNTAPTLDAQKWYTRNIDE
jgi:hypothetical protein